MVFYIIAAGLAVVSVILVIVGVRKNALKSAMTQTPTTPIGQLAQGQRAEIKGMLSCNAALEAPYSGIPCVYYSYRLMQRERRRSSSGSSTHTWRTIDSGSARVPFTLADASGTVMVDPEGADIDAPTVAKGPVRAQAGAESMPGGMLGTLIQGAAMLGMTQPRKVEVRAVALNQPLYVLGNVQATPDGRPVVAKGDDKFFVSTKSEEQLAASLGRQSLIFYVVGAALGVAAAALAVATLMDLVAA